MTTLLLSFYKIWHGRFGLKGAGLVIRLLAPHSRTLQNCPLRLPEGHSIYLDFRDVSAWYWLNFTLGDQLEEAGLIQAVCSVAQPGAVIWDVGANSGLFSYVLARKLPNCRIFYFEPNPSVYKIARSALRPFGNAEGLNIGLSSGCSTATPMAVPNGASTVGTINPGPLGRKVSITMIEVEKGDSLVESGRLPAPHILKIDTEGHEPHTLAGVKSTILEGRPTIFFEHISLSDSEVRALMPEGYKLCTVSDQTGELVAFNRKVGHNSAFLPQKI